MLFVFTVFIIPGTALVYKTRNLVVYLCLKPAIEVERLKFNHIGAGAHNFELYPVIALRPVEYRRFCKVPVHGRSRCIIQIISIMHCVGRVARTHKCLSRRGFCKAFYVRFTAICKGFKGAAGALCRHISKIRLKG